MVKQRYQRDEWSERVAVFEIRTAPPPTAPAIVSTGGPLTAVTSVAAASGIGARADDRDPRLPGPTVAERTWLTRPSSAGVRYGCASHIGPPTVAKDKGNDDFAFAVEAHGRDGLWLLCGVADGVGTSAWSDRAARHAAEAFVETTATLIADHERLAERLHDPVFRSIEWGRRFHDDVRRRIDADVQSLTSSRQPPRSWKPETYERYYFHAANAEEKRRGWLQTTLLAAALGPRGGFALFLGDGFARIDRTFADGRDQRLVVEVQDPDATAPVLRVSQSLTDADIEQGFRTIAPLGARSLQVTLATDGVGGVPAHGLDTAELGSSQTCRDLLEELAGRPQGGVKGDNMSVAFAWREVLAS